MLSRKLIALLVCVAINRQQMSLAFKSMIISSFGDVNTPQFLNLYKKLLGGTNGRLVYVPTAQYVINAQSSKSIGEQRRRVRYDARHKLKLLSDALRMENSQILELDDPNLTKQKLSNVLDKASVLYVDGGNTFYLQKYVLETNFWFMAQHALHSGCLYIGASAGGIIAGKSIETAYWKGWDDPGAAGEDFEWSKEKLQGGNICNGNSFFMHYDASSHMSLVDSKTSQLGHPVVRLSNTDACVFYPSEDCAKPALIRDLYNFGTSDTILV